MARRRLAVDWATLLVVVGVVLVGGCGTSAQDAADIRANTPNSQATRSPDAADGDGGWEPNAVVERVVDGDTIVARIGNRSETVRLIGLDAPETVAPTRPVQCFGAEASRFLEAVLPAGTDVTLVRDVEARDIYDRLLGYVVRSHDGLFVNLEMVTAGYAAVMIFPPNDHYTDALHRAEAEAIAAGRGLWRACGGPDVPLP